MIYGWDTSAWDYDRGAVDLAAAVRDGISFVTAKATEGTRFVDPCYARTARKALGVVPLFGAYHVLHPATVSPLRAQVEHYIAVLDSQSPWWRSGPFIVQLDCERWAAADFPQRADIAAWCQLFEARTGSQWRPLIYASAGQYRDTLAGLNRPLWNANYGHNRAIAYRAGDVGDSWPGWVRYSGTVAVIGQYGSELTIAGQQQCDANVSRLTVTQLRALAGGPGRTPATTPTEEPVPAAISDRIPAGFAFELNAADGKVHLVDETKLLVLNLPAGGQAGIGWGEIEVSLTADLLGTPSPRIRAAIHDGRGWAVDDNVALLSGQRHNLGPGGQLPAPATPTAYTVSLGRVRQSPAAADGTETDQTGLIPVAVLAELGAR
jgi:GH25 family lysozyme M1 (1,4-beta-N-acetylmuramidase)